MTSWLPASVANHLWQSTLFVALAWLVTLALRRHGARVRYSLWAAASLKFFLPFSWLIGLRHSGRVADGAHDRSASGDVRHAGDPCGATRLWRRSASPAGHEHRSVARPHRLARRNCGSVGLVGPTLARSANGAAQSNATAARSRLRRGYGGRAGLRRARAHGDVIALGVRTWRRRTPAASAVVP